MSKKNKIALGVLGTSNFSIEKILPHVLTLTSPFQLSGIATRSRERYQEAVTRLGIRENDLLWYPSYESLLESETIEAVYIPLPNSLHESYVEIALQCKKHVLVEKPATLSPDSSQRLCELAFRNGLVLMEDFHFLHHKQLAFIKSLITNGEIGDVRSISSSFSFNLAPPATKIRLNKCLGGGALFDLGVYPVRFGMEFLGRDLVVVAAQSSFSRQYGVDLAGLGLLVSSDNAVSMSFFYSFEAFYQCSLDVRGSKGKIRTERIYTCPPSHSTQIFIETAEGKRVIDIEADNQYLNMISHFFECIHDSSRAEAERRNISDQARVVGDVISRRDPTNV